MNLKVSDAKREEGFTLIELLVVVIIIGILAAIAIPVFLNQRERAWQGSTESDTRNAAIQVETDATVGGNYVKPVDGSVQLSENVTLHYTGVTDADVATLTEADSIAFQLCAEHGNLDGSAAYDSNEGGLQAWNDTQDCDANPLYIGGVAAGNDVE